MIQTTETFRTIRQLESPTFVQQELESIGLYTHMKELGIWEKMEKIGKKEPAIRCAEIASQAAFKLNKVAKLAGFEPFVSPKVTYLVGLLFKSGEAIDEEIVEQFKLRDMDPRILNLYKFPFYTPDRTIDNTPSLRMALLLHKLNYPWFAKQILHGPHPEFFEQAELPNILVALANVNLAKDENQIWHSYLNAAIGMFAISPYAERSDKMSSEQAKDWIDRSRMVAINTTLHHILRKYTGISFTDEKIELTEDELRQRWVVTQKIFKEFGFPLPEYGDITAQEIHLKTLKQWMKKYNIDGLIREKQAKSEYLLYDHSQMVGEILSHIGKQLNLLAQHFTGKPVFNEEYLYLVGYCHDAIKAFDENEQSRLLGLKRYEAELANAFSPEETAIGGISLLANEDTRLFAWLKEFEEKTELPERKNIPSLAYDFLLGAEHLHTIVSTLLSYADLTVHYDEQEHNIKYNPDITNRFINVVYERTSDPHRAVIGYAKLMAVADTLSWYLGIPLPKKESIEIKDDTLEVMKPQAIEDKDTAIKNLAIIAKVMNLFGIAIPKQLRELGNESK